MRALKRLWRRFFPDYMEGKGELISGDVNLEELINLAQKMGEFSRNARMIIAHNYGS
jgi:hypothetical protein